MTQTSIGETRMGGKQTCHLKSKQRRYISEHITGMMEDLAPLYHRHYCSHLLECVRNRDEEPGQPRPTTQNTYVVPGGEILLEGSMPQYLDGTWRQRHLQVTHSFAVESRDSKEVFKGGWGCKKELVLSGCQICTSKEEHFILVDNMCKHITDASGRSGGRMVFWDCPTAFPVLIQHPYSAPVCLATASRQEQTQWANILQAVVQHQSCALWHGDSPESRAFLDAVSSLKQQRGCYQPGVLQMGNEEEVLVCMVMEEVMSYLRKQVFRRMIRVRSSSRRKQAWIKLLFEVYRLAASQIKASMAALKKELAERRCELEQHTAVLQQTSLLKDHITHTMMENMCGLMLQSLLHVIIPRLDQTLHEVSTPICDAFASTRQYFLDTCDDIIAEGSEGTSVKAMLGPLCRLGPGEARMWHCLSRLEMGSEGQAWLQETWRVHSGTWRPVLLKAQNSLYRVVDKYVVTFRRLVSRYPCCCLDHSQLSAVLCRIRDRVIKQLDVELLAVRSQLILESILQLTLPTFTQAMGTQDLSCYAATLNSEQALFIHPDILYHCVLRDSVTRHIQSVMKHTLPQQCVPLPVASSRLPGSSSSLSEPVYQELLPSGACQQSCCQACNGSASGSHALTENTVPAQDVTVDDLPDNDPLESLNDTPTI